MPVVRLAETRTYKLRVAEYTPVRSGLGVLEVRESWVEGCKIKVSRYAVLEQPATDGFRTFRLTKPGGVEVYHATLMPHRRTTVEDRCCCHAGQGRGFCKHLEALRELIEEGHIPRVPG